MQTTKKLKLINRTRGRQESIKRAKIGKRKFGLHGFSNSTIRRLYTAAFAQIDKREVMVAVK